MKPKFNSFHVKPLAKSGIHEHHFWIFLCILSAMLCLYHITSPPYGSLKLTIINRAAYVLGFVTRIMITSYLLTLAISRVRRHQFPFYRAFPIVTFSSLTLLSPFIIFFFNSNWYTIGEYFATSGFIISIASGIWQSTKISLPQSLGIALLVETLYWLISVIFFPGPLLM